MSRSWANIEIEDDYVRVIMDRFGVHTKTEAVDLALRHLAGQPMSREDALRMRGASAIEEIPADPLPELPGDPGRHVGLGRVRPRVRRAVAAFDPDVDFAAAARIYLDCRRVGVTPRGLIDCMLVAVAWRHADTILAFDVDLDRVCGVVGVPLDPASLRAE